MKRSKSTTGASDRPELASLSESLNLVTGLEARPGGFVLGADVRACLLDAMTDTFHITRGEIENETVPSDPPIGASAPAWGMCLAEFAGHLRVRRAAYGAYTHRPRYTDDTLSKAFSDIVDYLIDTVISQITGQP